MPHAVLQFSTQGFYIFADDAESFGDGLAGLSITVSLSKAGGTFSIVAPTITDLGGGVYWIAPLAAHRDTLGEIAWRFEATGAVIAPRFERVVAVNDQVAAWGANTVAPDNTAIGDARTAAAAAAGVLEALTELAGEDARFTAKALELVDLAPVMQGIGQINGPAIAEDVAGRLSALVLTVQTHTIKANGELVIVRGDDYAERPIRIEIDTADDLSGLHLVIAALSEHGDRFAVRMPIQGTAPEHYASFCPPGDLTAQWPEGKWHLRHRIEYAPGKLSTVARSTMTIQTFATPEEITNLG